MNKNKKYIIIYLIKTEGVECGASGYCSDCYSTLHNYCNHTIDDPNLFMATRHRLATEILHEGDPGLLMEILL